MSIASVLESLRREYAPALKDEIAALVRAVEAEDWPGARAIAHRVAGTAGSYGFQDASSAARTIEDAIDAGAHDRVPPAVTALRECAP